MKPLVAFDVETHKIQRGLLCPPLVCGSISDFGSSRILGKEDTRDKFRQYLRPDALLAGANIVYDMLVMYQDDPSLELMQAIFHKYDLGEVFDVQLAEGLHAIRGGHLGAMPNGGPMKVNGKVSGRYSLAMVTKLVTGREDAKDNDRWRLSYALLENTPIYDWPPEARQYPVDDAVNTYEVALQQHGRNANLRDLPAQAYAAWAMHLGAAWGFLVDQDATQELKAQAQATKDEGRAKFQNLGFIKEDGKKNTPKIKRLVAEAYGATQHCTVCSGNQRSVSPKTGKEINCVACGSSGYDLRGTRVPLTEAGGVGAGRDVLHESGNEWLMQFADYTDRDKVLSTYVPWLEKGAPLYPNPLLSSGRASCGTAQTLPRDMGIRECIVARPGTVLISCDYAGLELGTHAQSCLWLMPHIPCKLAEAINAGIKVHDLLGSQMMGIPYEEFLDRRKSGDKKCGDIRQAAKAANFGFGGGMGSVTFVLAKRKEDFQTGNFKGLRFCMLIGGEDSCGTEMVTEWKGRQYPPVCKRCVECAEDLKKQWFEAWPENKEYFKVINKDVDRGYIVQHVSKRVRGGVNFCSAANGYFQGLAADGAKAALCRVAKEQYADPTSALWGSRSILFAHDEIIMEAPEERAHEAAMRLQEVMVEAMREYTPDVAVEAEPCLMRRWYKGAEPVWESGRLVPWSP